jgi:hypothetical protein
MAFAAGKLSPYWPMFSIKSSDLPKMFELVPVMKRVEV